MHLTLCKNQAAGAYPPYTPLSLLNGTGHRAHQLYAQQSGLNWAPLPAGRLYGTTITASFYYTEDGWLEVFPQRLVHRSSVVREVL